ncbi:hypothetical protein RvY_06088 [Ramazzottius varieornatus]|uniref:Uncharacterized protein n=1 Tax=Ramazzottius varieornatus TaxID=947166 RepID=A0A1D1V3R1_RAMVA|nr:hypothetical protein RvY_06088 [Ramazzottius varieornatus]
MVCNNCPPQMWSRCNNCGTSGCGCRGSGSGQQYGRGGPPQYGSWMQQQKMGNCMHGPMDRCGLGCGPMNTQGRGMGDGYWNNRCGPGCGPIMQSGGSGMGMGMGSWSKCGHGPNERCGPNCGSSGRY